MPLYGLRGIARAARLEAAGRPQPGRHGELVGAQDPDREAPSGVDRHGGAHGAVAPPFFANRHRIPFIWPPERPAAADRPITTRSIPGRSRGRAPRNHSRTCRLTRLRTTAEPTFRLTVMPSRCRESSSLLERGATRSTKAGSTTRRPSRLTRPNSLDRSSRSARRNCPVGPGTRLLRRRGDRHPLPTLRPTPREHRTAPLRLHALPETVRTLPARAVRLVGPLHRVALRGARQVVEPASAAA